ncbi:hypothetical protein LTT66_33180 [Nocardia gipuzkoensis]|uniref:hypothetical protein n=1 Tax=Nocardia gipuzkoensis TaxID=2749991 RepID=UPI001E3448C8|nr:hypothetical protein [Nocardia gipuzkoensis]UGT67970.1 hypothetical protein LTT66_33180 [Nocardia gipuzkoensis]
MAVDDLGDQVSPVDSQGTDVDPCLTHGGFGGVLGSREDQFGIDVRGGQGIHGWPYAFGAASLLNVGADPVVDQRDDIVSASVDSGRAFGDDAAGAVQMRQRLRPSRDQADAPALAPIA